MNLGNGQDFICKTSYIIMNFEEMKYRKAIISLASEYRKEIVKKYGRYPSFDEMAIGNYSPPTQVLFMHSDFPEIELILLFHSKERKDLDFHFYGSRDYNEMMKTIEAGVLRDPMCTIVGKEKVELSLAYLINNSMQYDIITVPFKNSILSGRSEADTNYSVQLLYGTILNINLMELARKIAGQTYVAKYDQNLDNQVAQDVPILDGLGSHTDPPTWIDSHENKSFIDKVYRYPSWKSANIVYMDEDMGGCKALICKDGYIAIGTKDKEKALSAINTLLGSMMVILNTPFNMIRENDLGFATFSKQSAGLSGGKFWTSSRDYEAPVIINIDKVEEIFTLAGSVMKDQRLKTELSLVLEAKAHAKNGEWKQAILIGWLFLEDIYIDDMWTKLLSERQMNEKKKDRLDRLNIDIKLATLNLLDKIDHNEYEWLDKLRRVRNGIIHRGDMPDKRDVILCMEKIMKILKRDLGKD